MYVSIKLKTVKCYRVESLRLQNIIIGEKISNLKTKILTIKGAVSVILSNHLFSDGHPRIIIRQNLEDFIVS